ncbi:hypothetical protein L829_4971 [Mycobacteroides abscessus MAB_030201_1075]|uniref:Uncharacterized protein n=1 Tax=Mycobacteroides abscessus MAB_030201_1075 TaxID=1335410 RepID=A0A829PGK9_9MYCO|nr:hypothetical protein L829_4971 [Mycobacteroides abscessus MAB_030201_1075]
MSGCSWSWNKPQVPGVESVPRRGLKTAIAMVRERRRNKVAV